MRFGGDAARRCSGPGSVANGRVINYELDDDDFIESASEALGMNLAPIFEFWGVPPSPEAADRLTQYPVPAEFVDRLVHYRTLVPLNNAEFLPMYERLLETDSDTEEAQAFCRENYDEAMAQKILARIDTIAQRHYIVLLPPDADGGTPAYTEVYATLLGAHLTGREINAFIDGCTQIGNQTFPVFTQLAVF